MKVKLNDYTQGDMLRILREWTGLKQRDFAHKVGKSERTIQEYEGGRVNYSIDTLYKIAEAFDITITFEKKK